VKVSFRPRDAGALTASASPRSLAVKRRRSERTVHPYGIVAHSGRWFVIGADSASGEVRTFRLDRIETAKVLPGSFEVPVDALARRLAACADAVPGDGGGAAGAARPAPPPSSAPRARP
jgi:hypothetical protein